MVAANRLLAVVLIVILFASLTWFAGNCISLVDASSPEQALAAILDRYGLHPNWKRIEIQEITSRENPAVAYGRQATYLICESGKPIARVKLVEFLKLGWQELSYESLKP